ncbi:hypothetical protein [Rhodococcus opacus]|nr:hypothetical protein [Rhodococcus opacus]
MGLIIGYAPRTVFWIRVGKSGFVAAIAIAFVLARTTAVARA